MLLYASAQPVLRTIRQCRPLVQGVCEGLRQLRVSRQHFHLFSQPVFQGFQLWFSFLLMFSKKLCFAGIPIISPQRHTARRYASGFHPPYGRAHRGFYGGRELSRRLPLYNSLYPAYASACSTPLNPVDGFAGAALFCPGCRRTTWPVPAQTRRCGYHERMSTTARSSFSYYPAAAPAPGGQVDQRESPPLATQRTVREAPTSYGPC